MRNICFLISALFLMAAGCKKKALPDPPVNPGYQWPYTQGSYWIYQWYDVDTTGMATATSQRDSIYTAGDTVINGHTYVVLRGSWYAQPNYQWLLRDSSGYIIDHTGTIRYSYVNFTDTLMHITERLPQYGMYYWYRKMYSQQTITTPAGTFDCIEARDYYYDPDEDTLTSCGDAAITTSDYYANGVGRVLLKAGSFTNLMHCLSHIEARLVDYHFE